MILLASTRAPSNHIPSLRNAALKKSMINGYSFYQDLRFIKTDRQPV